MSGLFDKMKTVAAVVGAVTVVGGWFISYGRLDARVSANETSIMGVAKTVEASEQRLSVQIAASEGRTREDIRDLRQRLGK